MRNDLQHLIMGLTILNPNHANE